MSIYDWDVDYYSVNIGSLLYKVESETEIQNGLDYFIGSNVASPLFDMIYFYISHFNHTNYEDALNKRYQIITRIKDILNSFRSYGGNPNVDVIFNDDFHLNHQENMRKIYAGHNNIFHILLKGKALDILIDVFNIKVMDYENWYNIEAKPSFYEIVPMNNNEDFNEILKFSSDYLYNYFPNGHDMTKVKFPLENLDDLYLFYDPNMNFYYKFFKNDTNHNYIDTDIMRHLLDNNLGRNIKINVGYLQKLFDKIIEIYSSYKFEFNNDKKYYNSDVIIFKHFKKIIKIFNEFEYFTPNIDKLFDAKFLEYEDKLINMNNDYMIELIEHEIETYDQRAFILKAIRYIYNGKILTEFTNIMDSEVFNEFKSQELYEENILSLIGKVYNPILNIEDLIPQELNWFDLKAKDSYDNKDIVTYKIIRLQHLKYLYKYLAVNV
jgi:hypothetical protein